jgi:hypothetical protein
VGKPPFVDSWSERLGRIRTKATIDQAEWSAPWEIFKEGRVNGQSEVVSVLVEYVCLCLLQNYTQAN